MQPDPPLMQPAAPFVERWPRSELRDNLLEDLRLPIWPVALGALYLNTGRYIPQSAKRGRRGCTFGFCDAEGMRVSKESATHIGWTLDPDPDAFADLVESSGQPIVAPPTTTVVGAAGDECVCDAEADGECPFCEGMAVQAAAEHARLEGGLSQSDYLGEDFEGEDDDGQGPDIDERMNERECACDGGRIPVACSDCDSRSRGSP
jgi:hypothetical protein